MYSNFPATKFTGYSEYESEAEVLGIIQGINSLKQAGEGEEVRIVLNQTPFYGEGGGKTGDIGKFITDGLDADVVDTIKIKDVYVHKVKILSGEIAQGDRIKASISKARRNSTARNHTATHLLHRALKLIIGNHIEQAGSYVTIFFLFNPALGFFCFNCEVRQYLIFEFFILFSDIHMIITPSLLTTQKKKELFSFFFYDIIMPVDYYA